MRLWTPKLTFESIHGSVGYDTLSTTCYKYRPFFLSSYIEEMQRQSTSCKRKHQEEEKHPDRKANRFRQEAEKLISVSAKNLTQVNVDEDSTSFMAYTWGEAERGQLGHGDEM